MRNMRKFVSLAIVMTLVLSLFATIPFVSASADANTSTITFDSANETAFYVANETYKGTITQSVHTSNVFSQNGYMYAHWSKKERDFFVAFDSNSNGALTVEPGEEYSCSFDFNYRSDGNFFDYKLYVAFVPSSVTDVKAWIADYLPNTNSCGKYIYALSDYRKIWTTLDFDFTVPANVASGSKMVFVPALTSDTSNGQWITAHFDNFVITKKTEKKSITYVYNDGVTSNKTVELTFGTAFEIPTRAGYKFGGWFTDSSLETSAGTVVSTDATVYAKWIPVIDFDSSAQQAFYSDSANCNGTIVVLTAGAGGSDGNVYRTGPNGVNLYEQSQTADWMNRDFFVAFDEKTNGAITVNPGTSYAVSFDFLMHTDNIQDMRLCVAFVPSNVTDIKAWFKTHAPNASGVGKYIGYNMNEFKGKWTNIPFDIVVPSTVAAGSKMVFVPALTSATSSDQNIWASFDNFVIEKTSKTVTYHYNDGVTADKTVELSVGAEFEMPERSAYDFAGWYTDAQLTQYAGLTAAADADLYAKWVQKADCVTFDTAKEIKFYNTSGMASGIIADSGVADHGNAFKINQIIANTSKGWHRYFKAYDKENNTALTVNPGITYKVSFEYMNKTSSIIDGIHFNVLALPSTTQVPNYLNAVTDPESAPAKIFRKYVYASSSTKFANVEFDVTIPDTVEAGSHLVFVPGGASGKSGYNLELYIDNLSVLETLPITIHNTLNGTDTINVIKGTTYDNVPVAIPGAKLDGLYSDAALTQRLTGVIPADAPEAYAAWKSVTTTFDGDDVYVKDAYNHDLYDLESGSKFHIVDYVGDYNSAALTDEWGSNPVNTNNAYPNMFKLINADGTDLKTQPGHTYTLSFWLKLKDYTLLSDSSRVGVASYLPSGVGFNREDELNSAAYFDNDYNNTIKTLKPVFNNTPNPNGFVKFTFTINCEERDSSDPIYVYTWLPNTYTYFENIKIVDNTFVKTIEDEDGNELAKGYIGETVTLTPPEADANGDTNFTGYLIGGNPVTTARIMGEDIVVSRGTAPIVSTKSTADFANKAINFRVRFEDEDIDYIANNSKVNPKYILHKDTYRKIKELGVIVADKALLGNNTLTVDNYMNFGGYKVSNGDLYYSVEGDGAFEVNARIFTGNFDREYVVLGFVKFVGGVKYGVMRSDVKQSFNGVAGVETPSTSAEYTHGSYKLVSNSEFNNSADDVYEKWHKWDKQTVSSGVTEYSRLGCAQINDNGELVLTTKKTSDTVMDIPGLFTNHTMTHGYVEVRAKFDSNTNLSGQIWLNSAGLDTNTFPIKPSGSTVSVSPEIDVVEFTSQGKFYSTLHSWNGSEEKHQVRIYDADDFDLTQYHTYGLERTSDAIKLYIDGTLVTTYTKSDFTTDNNKLDREDRRTEDEISAMFDNPVYVVLGCNFTASKFGNVQTGAEAHAYIDYVRFYE